MRWPIKFASRIKTPPTKAPNPSGQQSGNGFSRHLDENLQWFRQRLHDSSDLSIRPFLLAGPKSTPAALIFINGLVNQQQIESGILKPLMETVALPPSGANDQLSILQSRLLLIQKCQRAAERLPVIEGLLTGNTILMIDGISEALLLSTPGWEKRSITEPDTEVNIRGPREGFTETLQTNTALLRRKLGDPDLTFITLTLGTKSKTEVCIAYLQGITPDSLIAEIKLRLERIKTDILVGSGGLEQLIQDHPLSPFSTIGYTERPDVAAAKISEGRAVIFLEGSPVALTAPFLFVENFQYPDDYNFHFYYTSLIRCVRYTAFGISFLGPSIYVALTTYHPELLPTQLLMTLATATENTPFPKAVEMIIMGLIFEIIREGGIRLPRPIGAAISIVGALVIGQATVQAGLVGAPTVIVIASTAVTTFLFPTLVDETTLLRIMLVVISGLLGAFGMLVACLILLTHLVSIRSFGVPYFSPLAPVDLRGLAQDGLLQTPWWMKRNRPAHIAGKNSQRQADGLMPQPPDPAKN